MSARNASQWDEDRIRRFEKDQRGTLSCPGKREWINFAEIAEWFSELGGSGPNEEAREIAYKMLEHDLLAGHFEKGGRSQVLFLFPGVSWTHGKMTRQRLQDAIDNNLDNEHGRSYLKHCWLPQNLFKRWAAKHHLPSSPPRFRPKHLATAVLEPTGVVLTEEPASSSASGVIPPPAELKSADDISTRRRPAQEKIRQQLEEKAPEYINGPGGKTCWEIAAILVGKSAGADKTLAVDKIRKALERYYDYLSKDGPAAL